MSRKANFTPETSRVNSDILAAIARVNDANMHLQESRKASRDVARQEADVCVETRFAEATFYDVSRWTGLVDENGRHLLVAALQKSVELLEHGKEKYRHAVTKRLASVRKYQVPTQVALLERTLEEAMT